MYIGITCITLSNIISAHAAHNTLLIDSRTKQFPLFCVASKNVRILCRASFQVDPSLRFPRIHIIISIIHVYTYIYIYREREMYDYIYI